jgi:hypothetical protein
MAEMAVKIRHRVATVLEGAGSQQTLAYEEPRREVDLAHLERMVEQAGRKLMPAVQGGAFLEGRKLVQDAYVLGKQLLGEAHSCVLGRLYRSMAMVQAMEGDPELALDYWMTFRNLCPDARRTSENYPARYLAVHDRAEQRYQELGKQWITIRAVPDDAVVRLDGRVLPPGKREMECWPGGHLLQVEREGYHREGWIRRSDLSGTTWELTLRPLDGKARRDEYLSRLTRRFESGAGEIEGDVVRWMTDLRALLQSDAMLFLLVSREGENLWLRGLFVSAQGYSAVDERVSFDASVLEELDRVVRKASDLEAQAKEREHRTRTGQEQELRRWAEELSTEIGDRLPRLRSRQEEWRRVGDNNKVALFEQTVAAMEALAVRVKNALGDGGQDLERRGSTLRELTREVRAQEERFRSVMSWDVGRALTDDLADELDRLIAEGESLLQELRAAFPSGGAVRPGRRRVAPSEPDRLGSQMKAIRQELRADPWNEGVQGRLYAVLVEIHRLVRLHVKREAP